MRPFIQSGTLPKNVLFLSEATRSPTIAEQRAACEQVGDLIVDAGEVSFLDMPRALARAGQGLEAGDTIKVYDLTCLPINTMTLVRMMAKLLKQGVTIHFCALNLTILPDDKADVVRLISALDHHWRRLHGMKTHATDSKPGRKALLADEQIAEIRVMLDAKGATVASVAKKLGVGRTTLFDFLQRHRGTAGA